MLQVSGLQAQLAAARLSAERLSAERDRLLEISNNLRADLNRAAQPQPADGWAAPDGSERAHSAAARVDALEAAMAALAAHNGQLLGELAPLRARAGEPERGSGALSAEALEGGLLRASVTSAGSSNRSADGRAARTRAGETRMTLAGSASQLAGRPALGSASERETASQQAARERERQRQRAEAARKRALVPNYNRLSLAEPDADDAGQEPASLSPQRL